MRTNIDKSVWTYEVRVLKYIWKYLDIISYFDIYFKRIIKFLLQFSLD